MTVSEFVKLNSSGGMFRLVDATKVGYMNAKECLIEADKLVVRERYGKLNVVGFDAIGKNRIAIYVK